jgi:hypothetical protein
LEVPILKSGITCDHRLTLKTLRRKVAA